jgi:hypothetical protein
MFEQKSPLIALSMYCAASVYLAEAKEKPEVGLSNADSTNLEFIVKAMEAIARDHMITRAFLQQVCLDIERNGLTTSVKIPNLGKYKHMFGTCSSNIPLLARSSISKHTEISPPLPGRLPLGNPKGHPMGSKADFRIASCNGMDCNKSGPDYLGGSLRSESDGLAAEDGAGNANVNKRKRMSPEPVVISAVGAECPAGGYSATIESSMFIKEVPPLTSAASGSGLGSGSGFGFSSSSFAATFMRATAHVNLPHRGSPSASKDTPTQSSESNTTTPGTGLGAASSEDPGIDFSAFQGSGAGLFSGTTGDPILDVVFGDIGAEGGDNEGDPWSLLDDVNDMAWDAGDGR